MTLFLLKQFTPMSLKEIGELFQMDYAAVSQACKRYEEKTKKRDETI
jgi:chromosomal replication initiation ATPase DnaA